jgi:hypothetical protein
MNLNHSKHDNGDLSGDWSVTVVNNMDGIESIRPIWEGLYSNEIRPVPNTDIDRYIVIASAKKDFIPHIVLLSHKSSPKAMVVGFIERIKFRCKVGYAALYNPELSCLTVVYGGVLGCTNSEIYQRLIDNLLGVLKQGKADVLYFNHIPLKSPLYAVAGKAGKYLCKGRFPIVEPHWYSQIISEADKPAVTISGHRRQRINHNIKSIEKELSVKVHMRLFQSEQDVDSLAEIAYQIESMTYKRGMAAGVYQSHLTKPLLVHYAKRNSLRAYVLQAGSKPCAFAIGAIYGKTFFFEYFSHDPSMARFSPGSVLLAKVIDDLAANSLVYDLDYGFGDATYKTWFGSDSWQEASVYVFAPRLYPVFVNMVQSFVTGVSLGLGYILDRVGLVGWIKRNWRKTLQGKKYKSK